MPKYERLNTSVDEEGHDHKSPRYHGNNGDDDCEQVELDLNKPKQQKLYYNENEQKTNFKYINNPALSASSLPVVTHHHHHQRGSRFMQLAIGTIVTILLYLILSISLTFYQKYIIKKFNFPLTIVGYHLIIKFLLAICVRSIYKNILGRMRPEFDCRVALRKMAPTGIASGIDIGFSNWGLELVPISLYTMTKSSTIVFILFFAILLGLEKKSWSLVLIVGLIAAGLFMFTYKSTQFNALGFIFLLFASLSSGIRWTFAQFLMQKSKLGLHNPIDMIYHMQPWMIASILPFLVAFEGQKLYSVLLKLDTIPNDVIMFNMLKITLGAFLAFLMEISEFLVLSQTSSLTLSIAGIFKDICQLALAVELNGDQLSLINVLGLVVCLAGISCHLVHKYSVLTKFEDLHAFENEDDDEINEFNLSETVAIGANNPDSTGSTVLHNHNQHNTGPTVPLLEHSESDEDSENDLNKQSASDVIFDVLKRRDM